MKTPMLLLVMWLTGLTLHSQNFRYYKLGQNFPIDENACLVIKNDLRLKVHIASLEKYKDIRGVKLSGFNDLSIGLDSLLKLTEDLSKIEYIEFEDCDLSALTEPLDVFPALKEIRILKKCVYDESFLFPILKNCPIENLYFQTSDPEFSLDSAALLPKLKKIFLSNTPVFIIPNKNLSYQFLSGGNLHSVNVAYYGSLYNEKEQTVKPAGNTSLAAFKSIETTRNFKCVTPPVKNVNINDTVYSLNAASGFSASYYSGSRITIAPNSFLTTDGKLYSGKVSLFYREFRTPVEIMLSGIPMTNQENGSTGFFRSGGMYEAYAMDTKGNELKTKDESALKINFALTDTASDFGFYSLNSDGGWTTVSKSVNISSGGSRSKMTKAVMEYEKKLNEIRSRIADTTNYFARFYNNDYLYRYRRDNLIMRGDSNRWVEHGATWRYNIKRSKALFRVKFVRKTKDGEIVFMLVPAKKDFNVPKHISAVFNKPFVYAGNISAEEFKKTYNKKLLCWDLRTSCTGNTITFDIKTTRSHLNLSGYIVEFKDRNNYVVSPKASKILHNKVSKYVYIDGRHFNRRERQNWSDYNNMNRFYSVNGSKEAWEYSKKFQDDKEKKMKFDQWLNYVSIFSWSSPFEYLDGSGVGSALVESGLGIKNIDCYLHSGQMEDIFVRYNNINADTLMSSRYVMLYKNINTSFPLTFAADDKLKGHYLKHGQNYVIRFSENGHLQVTKPNELKTLKQGGSVQLDYTNSHYVQGLNSRQITDLIFEQ